VGSCRRRKIEGTKQPVDPRENLPFDPSSWATGRVGNGAARWVIFRSGYDLCSSDPLMNKSPAECYPFLDPPTREALTARRRVSR
jgi:hypothetical protein